MRAAPKKQHKELNCEKEIFRNLHDQYRLSTQLNPLLNEVPSKKTAQRNRKLLDEKYKFEVPKTKKIPQILEKESETLKEIQASLDLEDQEDEISAELEKLTTEFHEVNRVSMSQLRK